MVAVYILAERPLWMHSPANAHPVRVGLESGAETDDIAVTTSEGGRIWIQAKRSVTLSSRPNSKIFAAIDQFVRQYITSTPDPRYDRLVLAYAEATGPIRYLYNAIRRFHNDAPAPDQVVVNNAERSAFTRFQALLNAAWRAAKREPKMPWSDVQRLLRLLVFVQRASGPDGRLDDTPDAYLRDVVDHERAGDAMEALRSFMLTLASQRRAADLLGIRHHLRNAGIPLREPPSFRQDVAALRRHSNNHLRRLKASQFLTWNERPVPIPRTVAPTLVAAATARSLAIVGEPGVGKSSLLVSLAELLAQPDHLVVLLAAGELGATDLGALQRELDLQHPVAEVLANIPDPRPAYLLIDSLDAARGHPGVKLMLRQLITAAIELPENWRVVATVRRFDLLHNPDMRSLFALDRKRLVDRQLDGVAHLELGGLDECELKALSDAEPSLGQLVSTAAPRLRALLCIPFNLRLAVEVGNELTGVDSQRVLLERYWCRRVEFGELSERRADLMASLSRYALAKRTTRVPRADVTDRNALEALQHDGVIVNCEHGFIEASHHIVLDYAIARTLLLPDVRAAVARLEGSPDTAIFFRSSILMWLESLWHSNRNAFWTMTALAMKPSMPGAVRVAIAETIIAAVDDPADLEPLRRDLQNELTTSSATHTFRFLRGTLDAGARGPSLIPWFAFIRSLTRGMARDTFSGALLLLDAFTRRWKLTDEERAAAGDAARAALAAAWSTWADLATLAARTVVATIATSPQEAAALLRESLAAQRLDVPGLQVLEMLAMHTGDLLVVPDLVRDIYVRVLELDAQSQSLRVMNLAGGADEQTVPEAMRGKFSQLPWLLRRSFPVFLGRAPEEATIAVARVVVACSRYRSWIATESAASIEILGRSVMFSAISSEGPRYPDSNVVDALVNALADHIAGVSNTSKSSVAQLLMQLADENAPGILWAALIDAALDKPVLAAMLDELLLQPEALRLFSKPAARLLRSRWQHMPPDMRARIETAIQEIACDPNEDRVVMRLRTAIAPTTEHGDDHDQHSIASFADDDDARWTPAAQGISSAEMETPANRTVRDLQGQADHCLSSIKEKSEPTEDIVERGHNIMVSLVDAVGVDGVHDKVRDAGWGTVAELATAMSRLGDDGALPVLLEASHQSEPVPDEVRARQFATSPGWGGGAARLEAVEGLCAIARRGNRDALARCIELASDPVPEVRYQVARRLDEFATAFPRETWELAEVLLLDGNAGVAQAVLPQIARPRHEDRARVTDLISRALDEYSGHGPGHDHLRAACWANIAVSYVRDDDAEAYRQLERVASDLETHAADLHLLLNSIRPALIYGDDQDERGLVIRRRAMKLLADIARAACAAAEGLCSDQDPNSRLRADRPPIARLLSDLAEHLYHASGAFYSEGEDTTPLAVRARFFSEVSALLRPIGMCGVVEATDHVLNTLEGALRDHVDGVEPRATLALFLDLVHDGLDNGYENQWSGIDVVDRVIRWFLTEDTVTLLESDNLARISSVLDRFLDAGWPAAYRLARDLDQLR